MKKKDVVKGKRFSIGAILNITTGILMTTMDDIYDILNYLTGDNLFTHQLGRAADSCRGYLLKEVPWLDSPEFNQSLDKLKSDIAALDSIEDRKKRGDNTERIINKWLEKFVIPKTGKTIELHKISNEQGYTHQNPLEELEAMVGDKKKIIVVETP